MTTKFLVRFDGHALIPLEPVDLALGEVLEVERISGPAAEGASRPGSPQAIVRAMREPPHLDKADQEEFERLIEESQLPIEDGRIFGEEGR